MLAVAFDAQDTAILVHHGREVAIGIVVETPLYTAGGQIDGTLRVSVAVELIAHLALQHLDAVLPEEAGKGRGDTADALPPIGVLTEIQAGVGIQGKSANLAQGGAEGDTAVGAKAPGVATGQG